MADSNRNAVSIVAILAIVILVGIVVYFVMEEADDDVEIEFNSQTDHDVPVRMARHSTAGPLHPPPPAGRFRIGAPEAVRG